MASSFDVQSRQTLGLRLCLSFLSWLVTPCILLRIHKTLTTTAASSAQGSAPANLFHRNQHPNTNPPAHWWMHPHPHTRPPAPAPAAVLQRGYLLQRRFVEDGGQPVAGGAHRRHPATNRPHPPGSRWRGCGPRRTPHPRPARRRRRARGHRHARRQRLVGGSRGGGSGAARGCAAQGYLAAAAHQLGLAGTSGAAGTDVGPVRAWYRCLKCRLF